MSTLNKSFMKSSKYYMYSQYTEESPAFKMSPKIKHDLGDWNQEIYSGDRFIDHTNSPLKQQSK